jgi:hypothetical protein
MYTAYADFQSYMLCSVELFLEPRPGIAERNIVGKRIHKDGQPHLQSLTIKTCRNKLLARLKVALRLWQKHSLLIIAWKYLVRVKASTFL